LSKIYGVSVKTIRDIWIGRTWYRATCHLNHNQPLAPERLHKKAGRPKGVRDSKKRSKKLPSDSVDVASPIQYLNQNLVVAVEGHGQILTFVEDPQTKNEEANVQPASPIGPSQFVPPLPMDPGFPDEVHAMRFHDPFDESWGSGLWEKCGDDLDLSCLDTFDDTAPIFDPFEAIEFGEPNRDLAESW
jgi:hypothetical protein